MTPTNCPNCGAIVRGIQCEYCGTRFHGYGRSYTVTVRGDVPDETVFYDVCGTPRYSTTRGLLTPNEARKVMVPPTYGTDTRR